MKKSIHSFILILFFAGCSQSTKVEADPNTIATVQTAEPNPEALIHFMDAQLYISQNNYPMAILELQDALKLDPTAGSIHVSMAEAYWKLGKIERAEDHLRSALALDHNDVEARIMLAEQYIVRHEFDKAEKEYTILRSIEPKVGDHVIAQAELAGARMQWQKAIKLYREAYKVDNGLISALEKAAELSLRSNHFQIALEIYEELIKVDSRNIEYLSAYADLVIIDEQYDKAKDVIDRIIEIEGFSKERLFQSGIIFYQKQRLTEALEFFKAAYVYDDQDMNVLHFLASVFLEIDQPDSGKVYSLKQLQLDENDPRGYINSALAEMNKNQYDVAIQILSGVSEKFNEEYAIQYLLGNAYYQEKMNDDALVFLNRALSISPNSRNVLHILAIINDTMKDWSISDQLYEKLISSDSTDAQAFNNYAYSLVERNEKLDRALQYSAKAITLVPNNAAYLDTYGWILFKMGRLEEALNYIQHSIELENTNSVVLEHFGDILMRVNRKNDARKYYRKAFEFDQENEALKQKAYPE